MSPTLRLLKAFEAWWTLSHAWIYDRVPMVLWPAVWPLTVGNAVLWVGLALLTAPLFTPRIFRK